MLSQVYYVRQAVKIQTVVSNPVQCGQSVQLLNVKPVGASRNR